MFNIIYTKSDLHGTCYFEILPGQYQGKCWNEESIFLTETDLGFLIPSIKKAFKNFDYYSFHGINKRTWKEIIENLNEVKSALLEDNFITQMSNYIEFILITREEFLEELNSNIKRLKEFIEEFVGWIEDKLKEYKVISILGI